MRKPRKRLAEALIATSLFLAAPIAHARLSRGEIKPSNNIRNCLPSVREEFAKISTKQWGPVYFDCAEGFVRSLVFPAGSRADRKINEFLKRHWRLFDGGPVSLVDAGYPWQTSVYKRAGLPFHAGEIDSGRGPGPDGSTMAFYDLAPAFELPVGFSTKARIAKDKAASHALAIAAKRGHLPVHVERTALIIRSECLTLATHPPHAELVWWVQIRESDNKSPVACFIDAGTGEVCRRNSGCSSSTDAFAL